MPVQRALVGMLAGRLAVLVGVGQHVDLGMLRVFLILVHHVDLDLAERAREGDLRRGRQVDVAEQDQLVVEERLVHLVEHFRLDRLRERDAGDLAAERGMQRLDLERPVARLRLCVGPGPSIVLRMSCQRAVAAAYRLAICGTKAASWNFRAWLH